MVKLDVPNPAGIDVYFQDEGSVELGHVVSDDTGIVTGPMRTGGFVTVFEPFRDSELYTYASVQPGDDIVVNKRTVTSPRPVHSLLLFQKSPDLQAVELAAAGCEVTQEVPTTTSTTYQAFISATTCDDVVDLLAIAWNQDRPTGWTVLNDVTLGEDLDLSLATFAPVVAQDVTLANIPAAGMQIDGTTSDVATSRGVFLRARQPLPSGDPTLHFAQAAIPGAMNEVSVTAHGTRWVQIFDRYSSLETRSVDIEAHLLPEATCVGFSFDRNDVTWVEPASHEGPVPDYATATLDITRRVADDESRWYWHVLGPRGEGDDATTLRTPLLPDDLWVFNPDPADGFGVTLERGSVTGGYQAMRTSAPSLRQGAVPRDLRALSPGTIEWVDGGRADYPPDGCERR